MTFAEHQVHRIELEGLLFDTLDGATPAWLSRRFQDCQRHYDGGRTTAEFDGALRAFAASQNRPFELFVVGEGNFGKSTLLNALLGEEASRIDSLPETRCFLRYIFAEKPAGCAKVFARLNGDSHAWLKPLLGEGTKVLEPYDVLEYHVPLSSIERIVAGEVERCNLTGSKYAPAVVEIERQLHWTDRRLFPRGIRFVDTQGLDQLFGEDREIMGQMPPAATTTERFEQWMKKTPRGRHLDWQYRRCDAALWCVHAKKIGSAVTTASLGYFRKYGKRTVIALTNVDRFPQGPALQTVLRKAEQTYSGAADCIIPVSGRAALGASLQGDGAGIANSGLGRLVETLTRLCLTEGAHVRMVGQYVSLRTTEAQLRQALRTFLDEIVHTLAQLRSCRDSVDRTKGQALGEVGRKLAVSNLEQIAFVRKNLSGLELTDNGYAALVRMKPDDAQTRHETEASRAARSAVATADALARQLAGVAFRLPIFDADGKRAGDSVSVETHVASPIFNLNRIHFEIRLEGMFLKDVQLWWREKVWGWFSESARNKAQSERSRLERERREDAACQFGIAWEGYHNIMLAECRRGITSVFDDMLNAIDGVEARLADVEHQPLSATADRLTLILGHVCVPPAIVGMIVERMRTVTGGTRSQVRSPSVRVGTLA